MTPADMASLQARALAHGTPWSLDAWVAFGTGPGEFLVTETAGFAAGRVVGNEAELLTIVVAPEVEGRGNGRRLLTAFEVEAVARGARAIFLEVAETNARARMFYDRAGFAEVGRRRGYYVQSGHAPVAALILKKAVTSTPA